VLRARASNYDFGVIIYVPSGHLAVPSRPSRQVIPRSATSASRGPARYTRPCDYRATNRARARYRCRNLRRRLSESRNSRLRSLRMKQRGGGRRSRHEGRREEQGERGRSGGRLLKDERSSGLLARRSRWPRDERNWRAIEIIARSSFCSSPSLSLSLSFSLTPLSLCWDSRIHDAGLSLQRILSLHDVPDLDGGRRFRGGSETFKGWPEA